jgi:ribosomal protein S12 methylthiotransferase accessory factor
MKHLIEKDATSKGLRTHAQRAISAEQTLENVSSRFSVVGLTRLANITGLDTLGIPVILSTRPQAGYLSVDGGKGFTVAAAMASAAMECFERHAGENCPLADFSSTYDDLHENHRIPRADLPLARNSLFHPHLPEQWIWAENLIDGARVAVPRIMVGLERHLQSRSSLFPFSISSNGLNSGNTKSEALVGALYEVIERDATSCVEYAWANGIAPRRLNLSSATSSEVHILLEQIDAAGIVPVVLDCTIDTKVPTFQAYLCDLNNPQIGLYHGYGTHLNPHVALMRALCEAAQGRLVYIAGSRDDCFDHHRRVQTNTEQANQELLALPEELDFNDIKDASADTFEADCRILCDKLQSVGVHQILTLDLTNPSVGVDVCRVIAPTLEGAILEDYVPGRRAVSWLEKCRGRGSLAAAPQPAGLIH